MMANSGEIRMNAWDPRWMAKLRDVSVRLLLDQTLLVPLSLIAPHYVAVQIEFSEYIDPCEKGFFAHLAAFPGFSSV
jgi:hypothetical protein